MYLTYSMLLIKTFFAYSKEGFYCVIVCCLEYCYFIAAYAFSKRKPMSTL